LFKKIRRRRPFVKAKVITYPKVETKQNTFLKSVLKGKQEFLP
jgi:hypothetical protein